MRKYIVEFIGTFFLVATVGLSVIGAGDRILWAPMAIGGVLMAMVYAGGHISGAHYNPAVTLAVFLRGKCAAAEVPGYMLAQFTAALAAATLATFLEGSPPVDAKQVDTLRALLGEFLFTFALAWVVLNVATAKGTAGNSFYGLAIGFTVLAGAVAVGNISGAAFNPAVALGATVMGLLPAANLWIYLVACFAGGAAAAWVFARVNADATAPASS